MASRKFRSARAIVWAFSAARSSLFGASRVGTTPYNLLMDGYVSAGEVTARRIAVTDLDGEEVVVGAGSSVVGHVHTESDLLFTDLAGSGEVRVIVIEAKTGDLQSAEIERCTWIVVAEVTD